MLIEIRLREQNGPLVQLLLAIFGSLSARFLGFLAVILLLLAVLPFKANFGFALFVS